MTESRADEILSAVELLLQDWPQDDAAVTRLTGATLRRSGGNEYFDFQRGGGSPPFGSVELRSPTGAGLDAPQLLVIELAEGPCITIDQIVERLGSPTELRPAPHGAAGALMYYSYSLPQGRLSLGFSHHESACLRRLVLESDGRPRTDR